MDDPRTNLVPSSANNLASLSARRLSPRSEQRLRRIRNSPTATKPLIDAISAGWLSLRRAEQILVRADVHFGPGTAWAKAVVNRSVARAAHAVGLDESRPRQTIFRRLPPTRPNVWSEIQKQILGWMADEFGLRDLRLDAQTAEVLHMAWREFRAAIRVAAAELRRRIAALHAPPAPTHLSTANQHLGVLGLPHVACLSMIDFGTVRRAHRLIVRHIHPDILGHHPAVLDRFREIQHAYDSLMSLRDGLGA